MGALQHCEWSEVAPRYRKVNLAFYLIKGIGREQLICLQPKRPCNTLDIVQRDVSSLTLNVSNEGAMEARLKSQGLLRPSALSPQTNQV